MADDGLWSALGEGFRGMGAVANPRVAQNQAQERENALPKLLQGLQVANAKRAFDADTMFGQSMADVDPTTLKTSDDLLNALKKVSPAVLATSPRAQAALKMAGAMQQKEALAAQREQTLELQRQRIELEQARLAMVQGKAPPTRNRISGDQEIQEEYDPSTHSWREIGKGPRFAKQAEGGAVPSGYRRGKDGNLEFIPGGPADPKTKEGKLGNRESVFLSRVMTSANEAAKDLENVVRVPMTASRGIFGGRQQGAGLFDATKEVLANKMTGQEAQSYNVRSAGFQRSLAAIEASGLAPSGTLSHQMDAVLFKEGDTNFTKLEKLAQTRQIVEAGLETAMSNPRVPDPQIDHMKAVLAQIKKAVPFTIADLDRLREEQKINPKATLGSVLKAMGDKKSNIPSTNDKGWKLMTDAKGNKAYVGPNNEIEEVK